MKSKPAHFPSTNFRQFAASSPRRSSISASRDSGVGASKKYRSRRRPSHPLAVLPRADLRSPPDRWRAGRSVYGKVKSILENVREFCKAISPLRTSCSRSPSRMVRCPAAKISASLPEVRARRECIPPLQQVPMFSCRPIPASGPGMNDARDFTLSIREAFTENAAAPFWESPRTEQALLPPPPRQSYRTRVQSARHLREPRNETSRATEPPPDIHRCAGIQVPRL